MKTIPCLSRGFLALGLAACTSDGSTDSGTPPSSVRSISIAAPPLPLTIGTSVHLTAIALGNDGPVADTAAITWSGSNPQVVSVSSSGVVTAVGAGTATVTARDGTLADRATIDVTASPLAAIHLIAPSFQLHIGEAFQLIATATDLAGEPTMPPTVMWASSRPDVASVSSTGMLTVHAFGSTTVEAVAGLLHAVAPVVAGPVNVAAIELIGPPSALAVGATYQVTAKERLTDGTTVTWLPLQWTSSTPIEATVSDAGVVTALATGVAEITATYGGTIALLFVPLTAGESIDAAILPSSEPVLLVAPGQTLKLTPIEYYNNPGKPTRSPGQVVWTSDDAGIASVSADGVVTGVAPGATTIRAMIDQHPAERAVQVMATPGTATIRMISAANDYPEVTMHPTSGTIVTLPYGAVSEQTVPAGALQVSLDGIPPLTAFYFPAIFDVQVFYGVLPAGSHSTFIAVNSALYASYAGPAAIAWLTDRTEPVSADSAVVRMLLATDAGYNVYFTDPGGPTNLLALQGCYLDWPFGYTDYATRGPGDFDIVLQSGKLGTSGPEVARFHVTAQAAHATTFLVTGRDLASLHVTPIVDN